MTRWLVSTLTRRAKAHLIVHYAFGDPLTACGLILSHDASDESPGDTRCSRCLVIEERLRTRKKEAARG